MKKLKLDIDALNVESFDVTPSRGLQGTVAGAELIPDPNQSGGCTVFEPPCFDPSAGSCNTFCPNATCTYTGAAWGCTAETCANTNCVTCNYRCVPPTQFESCGETCTIG